MSTRTLKPCEPRAVGRRFPALETFIHDWYQNLTAVTATGTGPDRSRKGSRISPMVPSGSSSMSLKVTRRRRRISGLRPLSQIQASASSRKGRTAGTRDAPKDFLRMSDR